MLYCTCTCLGQQTPSTVNGRQVFSIGVHCPQVMAMAMPSERFTVTMMNQTAILVQPFEMRKIVMANEVLLQQAERIEKVPARLVIKR